MDAGVLQLHIFQHDSAYEPMRFAAWDNIRPTIQAKDAIEHRCNATLVVPTFFNKNLKASSLRHLLQDVGSSDAIQQIVLAVADGAPENLEEYATATSLQFDIVDCPPDRRAEARNRGRGCAVHEYLVFLDDDMLLQDWKLIDVILDRMRRGSFDVALFPRRNFAKFPVLYDVALLQEVINQWRISPNSLPKEQLLDPIRDGSIFKTMAFCFPGCFMAISAEAYDRLGGFPEEYSGWGFEDSEFAIRAIQNLKVLNLFRAAPPLLHIDHPVSPYKSEEYQKNLNQFFQSHNPLDMDWLCRKVFSGNDIYPHASSSNRQEEYFSPLEQILQQNQIPLNRQKLRENYRHVIEARIERGLDPMPSYSLLTGSRGSQTHSETSDYDLLFLYRGGTYAEHFVTSESKASVEVEYASLGKFEEIASVPVAHPFRGPLEIAKLAQGQLLWGNKQDFLRWQCKVLRVASAVGFPVWLLYGIGMRLQPQKFASQISIFFRAIGQLLEAVHNLEPTVDNAEERLGPLPPLRDPRHRVFPEDLALGNEYKLCQRVIGLLDSELEGWREDLQNQKRVFAMQVPEIWHALHHLIETEKAACIAQRT